jgi:hypothetical protein
MSRAFVNEDSGQAPERYPLPARDDPGYPLAAARALLRGADLGDTPEPRRRPDTTSATPR